MPQLNNRNKRFILAPTLGILIFVIFYIIAAGLYPGGSQIDENSVGFSWINNYWCNLLDEYAINGAQNHAKPVAVFAMLILCISLSVFWFLFPKYVYSQTKLKGIIQISGIVAMTIAFLLITDFNHDAVSYLAAAFGFIATIGTFLELLRLKWKALFVLGIFNLFFIGVNSYVYYTNDYIIYLPLIQKMSFAFFLMWIVFISTKLYRHEDSSA